MSIELYSVDVIIPVYNGSHYIEDSVNSVLNQTHKNLKIIIINDCSTDSTLDVINSLKTDKIKIFNLKRNKGQAFCRNLGLRNSNSQFICFLDSDDYWDDSKIEKQIHHMISNNLNFSYTNYVAIKKNKKKKVKVSNNYTYRSFLKDTSIPTSSIMVKKDLIGFTKFKKKGHGFDDYIFKCDLLIKKNMRNLLLDEYLVFYNIRKGSISSNSLRNFFWIWNINKNYNKLNFFKNIYCLILISLKSLVKYTF
jgi:teichuronic acid biosynthesis glycosyltransferase TuaG